MHIAQTFEALLEIYRRPDGRKWSGQEIDEATGGVVSRSYVTNLRKGRIDNPGYAKLAAMAKAMGLAPEVWFEYGLGEGLPIGEAVGSRDVAGRLQHLFDVVTNSKTGKRYTNAEVARMTLGDLSEEDVEKIRTGAISDPGVGQVAALASASVVSPCTHRAGIAATRAGYRRLPSPSIRTPTPRSGRSLRPGRRSRSPKGE
jgi:transcriptional regulator with XRE-family HTH domain